MILKKIREEYKKCDNSIIDEISTEAFEIDKKFKLDNKINILLSKQCYITLKEHKNDFSSKMQSRLINPTVSEIGIINKRVIDNINKQKRSKKEFNQWISSNEVLTWFRNL